MLLNRLPRPLALAAVTVLLVGCASQEVTVGDADVSRVGGSTTAASPDTAPDAVADADLEAKAVAVGEVVLRLPAGWRSMGAAATPGEGSTMDGGAIVTSVDAQGRDLDAWVSAIAAGETELFTASEGMSEGERFTSEGGHEIFHLTQTYSDDRAQIFGFVADGRLHLLRFGLGGDAASIEVARKSAATLALA